MQVREMLVSPNEAGKAGRSEQRTTTKDAGFRRPLCPTLTEASCSINPNLELARVLSTLLHQTHGVPSVKGTTTTRRLPSVPIVG